VNRDTAPRFLALAAYATLLFAAAPAWPDDWDGIGFVASVHDFDLARFHPHAPGYPVYVALLRAAAVLARDPIRACAVIAAASGALTMAFAWGAARRLAGQWAAWAVVAAVGVSPLVWRSCSGVGTEAPALACAAACAWGLVAARPERPGGWGPALALGLGAGLGLGVRLSWAPLYLAALALAAPGIRWRAWGIAVGASAVWAAPLVAIVGPVELGTLVREHLAGHAQRWGGTVVTQRGAVRLVWLLRDVFVDGLGVGDDALGVMLGVLVAMAAVAAIGAWRTSRWRGWARVLAATGPYLIWISLGQNLRDQPRHVLPLVALLAAALALRAVRSPAALGVVCTLALLMSVRTARDAISRREVPPPGEQLVALARAQPDPGGLAVFGVASVRFFEPTELATRAFTAGALGDVQVQLARMEVLPRRVWVTSEVERLGDAPGTFVHVARLCRPPRLDRRAPCVDVEEWRLSYLLP
jgi:hypothetical protein